MRIGSLRNQSIHHSVELQGMGKVLNEYFFSVFTVEKDVWNGEVGTGKGNVLSIVHVTVEKALNVDISPRPDQIYPRIVSS